MNFWKILRRLLEEMFGEWQDKYISYKYLKKQLNLIYPTMDSSDDLGIDERPNKRRRLSTDDQVDKEIEEKKKKKKFLKLLAVEIKKINGFFMDKEEECIIRLRLLKAAVSGAPADSREELVKVERKLVDFHGEMILLKNYSALNYIGLLKILKKYEKRSGDPIRLPFARTVLDEPFYKTEVINNLVEECDTMIGRIISQKEELSPPPYNTNGFNDQPVPEEETYNLPEVSREVPVIDNPYSRLTRLALRTMRQIRNGSSTVSMFSLPPMEDGDSD